ncbi:MAG: type I methionyl aminopeptidase [Patescibacteria group bacterium]|nr:type I methionyl aminopeptidase [Patescibacteria group bacterium]
MKIELKNQAEIAKMRQGGKIASRILKSLESQAKEGVTTLELDQMAEKMILEADAKPSFKGFQGYPGSVCISVNEEVVHGIPSTRILKDGDVVGLDIGVYYQGFHTDTALTCVVGDEVSPEIKKLLEVTLQALSEGIKLCKAGVHLGDVQNVIQKTVEGAGFGVIRDLVGHGVGRALQEPPQIPNYGEPSTGPILKEGITLAIEPMVSMGDWHIKILNDHWTVVTADKSLSAHFEHTIVVGKNNAEILTK